MFCPRCGTQVPAAARFCPGCGTDISSLTPGVPGVAQRAAAVPMRCSGCGAELAAGKRFCTRCGQPVGSPTAPLSAPAPGLAQPRPVQPVRLDRLQIGALAGLGIGVIATTLDWASTSFGGVSAWDGNAQFRIGDWLNIDNFDALLVIAIAVVGAIAVLQPLVRWPTRTLPYAAAGAGVALVLLGALEWYYVTDVGGPGVDPGIGLYALIGGGIATAGCAIARDRRPLAA